MVKNKIRMYAFTTSVRQCTESSSQGESSRNSITRGLCWKGRSKTLQSDDMIYIENPKESTFTKAIRLNKQVQKDFTIQDQYTKSNYISTNFQ